MDDPTFAEELARHSAPICLPASDLTRLRKIEAAARALTVDFNGGLFEFNIRLRTLKAAVENETDG